MASTDNLDKAEMDEVLTSIRRLIGRKEKRARPVGEGPPAARTADTPADHTADTPASETDDTPPAHPAEPVAEALILQPKHRVHDGIADRMDDAPPIPAATPGTDTAQPRAARAARSDLRATATAAADTPPNADAAQGPGPRKADMADPVQPAPVAPEATAPAPDDLTGIGEASAPAPASPPAPQDAPGPFDTGMAAPRAPAAAPAAEPEPEPETTVTEADLRDDLTEEESARLDAFVADWMARLGHSAPEADAWEDTPTDRLPPLRHTGVRMPVEDAQEWIGPDSAPAQARAGFADHDIFDTYAQGVGDSIAGTSMPHGRAAAHGIHDRPPREHMFDTAFGPPPEPAPQPAPPHSLADLDSDLVEELADAVRQQIAETLPEQITNLRPMLLDPDVLRPVVADLVRKEFAGALGERLTRSMRKLVRQEVSRALTLRRLD